MSNLADDTTAEIKRKSDDITRELTRGSWRMLLQLLRRKGEEGEELADRLEELSHGSPKDPWVAIEVKGKGMKPRPGERSFEARMDSVMSALRAAGIICERFDDNILLHHSDREHATEVIYDDKTCFDVTLSEPTDRLIRAYDCENPEQAEALVAALRAEGFDAVPSTELDTRVCVLADEMDTPSIVAILGAQGLDSSKLHDQNDRTWFAMRGANEREAQSGPDSPATAAQKDFARKALAYAPVEAMDAYSKMGPEPTYAQMHEWLDQYGKYAPKRDDTKGMEPETGEPDAASVAGRAQVPEEVPVPHEMTLEEQRDALNAKLDGICENFDIEDAKAFYSSISEQADEIAENIMSRGDQVRA